MEIYVDLGRLFRVLDAAGVIGPDRDFFNGLVGAASEIMQGKVTDLPRGVVLHVAQGNETVARQRLQSLVETQHTVSTAAGQTTCTVLSLVLFADASEQVQIQLSPAFSDLYRATA
ncbi:hypothetical protein [Paraburkholderia graminis]|uniref:hypothetical protein n=1 Tax=Paraburkholderia graminis TaxID=60548 RepID=UPI0038BDD681